MKQQPTIAVTVRLTPAVAQAFLRTRKRLDLSQAEAITQAIYAWLAAVSAQQK